MLQLCRPQHRRGGRNDRAEEWREKLPLQQQQSPRSAQASPQGSALHSSARGSVSLHTAHEGPTPSTLCLRLLKGQQKATRTAKDRLVTSPPLLQSLENNHHIPKVGITKACRKHLPFPREKGEHYQRAESGDGINESSSAV